MEPAGPETTTTIEPAVSPLTERVLRRLGRPKWAWISLWSLVALVSPLVFTGAIRLSGRDVSLADFANLLVSQAVIAYACFILLWGCGILGRQATDLRHDLARLAPGAVASDLFRGIGDVAGPLVLAAAVVALSSANALARFGPLPALTGLAFIFTYMVPIATFVWVYLTTLIDIDRLGRQPMALEGFPQDRTLGLEKVGSLASTGFGLVLAAAVPVLLAGSDQPVTLGVGLAVVVATVLVFVLSMWRLHRQMAAAKARIVDEARRLYSDAYAPIREHPNLETLEKQSTALRVAQQLDERAHNLLTWPIDESTLRFMVVVVTGVVTSLVVRGLFAAIGF